ncbi:hypothetical protein ACFCYB_34010 [Streptomyces sp. NPDC056309]|uniref:hypothetical protein n=1 Tax=unclassified Streptomyces TaxID=2593676 RepID=UPI0035D949AD
MNSGLSTVTGRRLQGSEEPMSHLLTVDPGTGLRRSAIRFPDGEPPLPDGCRWCGATFLGHGSKRWAASQGWHRWAEPTEAQTAARQAARKAAPPVPARTRCDAMNHNSIGSEVFCEIEDPDHEEDHDAGDGITWPRED